MGAGTWRPRDNLAPYLFIIISIFIGYFKPAFGDYHSTYALGPLRKGELAKALGFTEFLSLKTTSWIKHTRQRVARLRRGVFVLHKHGHILLSAPDLEPVLDITTYKDVSTNPGPKDDMKSEKHFPKCAVNNGRQQGLCFGSVKHI